MKSFIRRIPILRGLARRFRRPRRAFPGSTTYWEERYARGEDSGAGSYGKFARFKAETINAFVAETGIASVIEFGCGDGNQLTLARYPIYLGLDVSATAVDGCRKLFARDSTKTFRLMSEYRAERADLALSLDVLFHLVEDAVFEAYMRSLFAAADRFVIVYSSDFDDSSGKDGPHVRHRRFSDWVRQNIPGWKLSRHVPNEFPHKGDYRTGSFAEFFVYERASPAASVTISRRGP